MESELTEVADRNDDRVWNTTERDGELMRWMKRWATKRKVYHVKAQRNKKRKVWTENRLARISFTLKKALADEVVWDYLNQDTEWVKRTRREEGDKETGREEVGGVMSY